jgi:hypothetical protein
MGEGRSSMPDAHKLELGVVVAFIGIGGLNEA